LKRTFFSIIKKNTKYKKKAVILTYHRVAQLTDYPYPIVVSPENFTEQMKLLKENYNPLPIGQLVEAINKHDIPDKGVVVTFDDGYLDNFSQALPILEACQIPATVFVTTSNVSEQREFWWDELENILLKPSKFPKSLTLHIDGHDNTWHTSNMIERNKARRSIHLHLRSMNFYARQQVLDDLAEQVGKARETRNAHRSITKEDLRQLSLSKLITIGAHTVTHPILSSLPYEKQYKEFQESRLSIEGIINKSVEYCSYPYGSNEDFNNNSLKAVRKCDFRGACTTIHRIVDRSTDPIKLPRCGVDDWDGKYFNQRLEHYFCLE
jgi:peptidoglycan/xylan/chitin deacetylase (PgdA/CDA1 family)